MSTHYENTATRLRPKSFKELTGQDFVVSTISASIEQDSIAPAYLFSGPRGVGKTSAARLVALAINRPEGTDIHELNYEGSEDIRLGKSLDVIEIDGASYTSVENVRNIREDIMYAPAYFKYKVIIIDEVHMLSNSAFNALLKTIEEPPHYVVFIFATTELHKVPATIRSRCQQFSFRLISITDISAQLEIICKQEQVEAEPIALQWIAKEAQGSFRDAYTLYDQIKAFSHDRITVENIKTHLGLTGLDILNEIFLLCLNEKRMEVLSQIDSLIAKGVSVEQFVIESVEYIRNLLLLKTNIRSVSVLGFAPEFFNKDIYEGFSINQLERGLSLLLECYRNLRYSVNTRFDLELVFSQLCELSKYVSPKDIVEHLHTLKGGGSLSNQVQSESNNQDHNTNSQNSSARESLHSHRASARSAAHEPENEMKGIDEYLEQSQPKSKIKRYLGQREFQMLTGEGAIHHRGDSVDTSPQKEDAKQPRHQDEIAPHALKTNSTQEISLQEERPPTKEMIAELYSLDDDPNSIDSPNTEASPAEPSTEVIDLEASDTQNSALTREEYETIWTQAISYIRKSKESFAEILTSAERTFQGDTTILSFEDEERYNTYLEYEQRVHELFIKMLHRDIKIIANVKESSQETELALTEVGQEQLDRDGKNYNTSDTNNILSRDAQTILEVFGGELQS